MVVDEDIAEELVALAMLELFPFRCFVVEAEAAATEGVELLPMARETETVNGEPVITEMLKSVVVVGVADVLLKRDVLEAEYTELPF